MNLFGILIAMTLVLSVFALWVYALISAIKNENLDSNMRLIWVLVIILLSFFGALLYLFVAPNRRTQDEKIMADLYRRNLDLKRRANTESDQK